MPKKKKQPRKKPARRTNDTGLDGYLPESPARTWLLIRERGGTNEVQDVMANWPFTINNGGTTTLTQMAAEAGEDVAHTVEALVALEDMDASRWDGPRNTLWLTIPGEAS